MTCREAQSCIVPFIEDKMDDERMEQFLHHIENCSECYDELEVYFIVFRVSVSWIMFRRIFLILKENLRNIFNLKKKNIIRSTKDHCGSEYLWLRQPA